ncbi:hypothetical protein A4X06_0g9189 [Tilletia controversa]|uniref:Uncharacterized protein n=1 Tax=Tilletia controversa TaxID=13291 RepID=A0A8X7MIQ5_9BASI|nr:hypothetical protein A4X06_0g9189 [Tilletia controversa]
MVPGVRSTSIVREADDLALEDGQCRTLAVSPGTTSKLSSKGKYAAYEVAHENARNALIKDNGRDHAWVPNPTLTSMSSGAGGGPAGYGVLDPVRLADMLASADTRLLLPYLVGRGKIEARSEHRYWCRNRFLYAGHSLRATSAWRNTKTNHESNQLAGSV